MWGRILAMFRSRRLDRDLELELEAHLAMLEEHHLRRGLTPEQAHREARIRLGGLSLLHEQHREVRGMSWIESARKDFQYAVRSLQSQIGFTFMALLALVLGIGLNTSLFTAINSVWTRPWDVPEPDRVVSAFPVTARGPVSGFALTAARFLNENSRTIEGAFAYRFSWMELDGDTGGAGVNTALVSGNFFDVLHLGMRAGRAFTLDDDVASAPVAVAVLSSALWHRRYASSTDILGRTIRIEGVPFTVIGVAPESWGGIKEVRTDIWIPMASLGLVRANSPSSVSLLTDPGRCCSEVGARLKPGVTRQQAQAELNVLFQRYLAEVNRTQPTEFQISRAPADVILTGTAVLDNPDLRRRAAPILAVVVAAFGSVLLLACANVSNLLLARAWARQREIALRMAVGAGRSRVVRQLLTESLLLASCASFAGLLLAFVLPGVVLRFMGQGAPSNLNLTPDIHVLAYSMAIAALTTIGFGLAPALQGTRISLNNTLNRQSSQASPRFPLRSVLLSVQVTVSVALLMAAGLLVRAVDRARSVDPAFKIEGVSVVQVTLPANAYDIAREKQFYRDLLATLKASGKPVAVSMLLPLGDRWENTGFGVRCNSDRIVTQRVTPEYFEVLGITFVEGATFPTRGDGRRTMVVDESTAHACWEGRSAVGQTVNMDGVPFEVVGVVRDAQLQSVGTVQPTYFAPFEPDGSLVQGPAFVISPTSLTTSVVATVRNMDPGASTDVISLSDQRDRSLGSTAGVGRIAGTLGLLALLLATVGVYGVLSYSVEQRRREIGIRMALGARPMEIVVLVLRRNARAVAVGLALGLMIAAGESAVLRSRLHGLSPADPWAYVFVLGLMTLAGVVASMMPAWRATRTDAVKTLHHE